MLKQTHEAFAGGNLQGLFSWEVRMTREELERKIAAAKEEMQHCGPIHRRDLCKHIRRMEKQLRIYDSYHSHAQNKHRSA